MLKKDTSEEMRNEKGNKLFLSHRKEKTYFYDAIASYFRAGMFAYILINPSREGHPSKLIFVHDIATVE